MFSMDESAIKGLELLESTGSDADIQKSRSIRRIWVEGYDTSLPMYDLDAALREHFSSCGELIHVYIPRDVKSGILNRFALIYVGGEVAEEKALSLSGREMGGRVVVAKAYPFEEEDLELARMRAADCRLQHAMGVTGYDTWLPNVDVENMLINHFSSCGNVLDAVVTHDTSRGCLDSIALVYIRGEDAVEKALKLSGRDVGGLTIVVTLVAPPDNRLRRGCGGYTHPRTKAYPTAEQIAH